MTKLDEKKRLKKLIDEHIQAFLKKGEKITYMQTGESDIHWRTRLNPDASKREWNNAKLDSDKSRKS